MFQLYISSSQLGQDNCPVSSGPTLKKVEQFQIKWQHKWHCSALESQLRRANWKAGIPQTVDLVSSVFTAFGWRCRNQTSPTSRLFPLIDTMEKWPLIRLLLGLCGLNHSLFYVLTPEQQNFLMRYVVSIHWSGTKITESQNHRIV